MENTFLVIFETREKLLIQLGRTEKRILSKERDSARAI